ncbi:MAG: hypothetical protein RLZZ631_614, partial [Cyanobacteriota bacterium]
MPVPLPLSRLVAVLGSASLICGAALHDSCRAAEPPAPAGNAAGAPAQARPDPGLIEATPTQKPPLEIQLRADSQGFDLLANRFVAVGNAKAVLAGGRLLADRIEYETATRTLYASGRIRFQRGSQYLQASRLRYSLIENSGEIEEVYGVLDLDSAALDLNPSQPPSAPLPPLSYWPAEVPAELNSLGPAQESAEPGEPATAAEPRDATTAESVPNPTELTAAPLRDPHALQGLSWGPEALLPLEGPAGAPEPLPGDDWRMPPVALSPAAQTMACPPPLPPIPDWHPYPWAATL